MENIFDDILPDKQSLATLEQPNIFDDILPDVKPVNIFDDIIPEQPQKAPISVWKEAPIKTMATFGKGLVSLPKQIASKLLMGIQGIEGASVTDRGWGDKYIDLANKDAQKFVEEIGKKYDSSLLQEVAQLPQNLAYSLVSMGVGAAVGIPVGAYATPAAGFITGAGASGVAAYRMTTYEIMQEFLELKDNEMVKKRGKGINAEEEYILKENFKKLAKKYGLWEAIPEAISNLAFAKILLNPLTKIVGKAIAGKIIIKVASLYGEELLTETVTEMGQKKVRAEADFPDAEDVDWTSPSDWWKSLKSIAPQTFLLTTVMGGAGSATIETSQAVKSLKKEIGEKHPLYEQLKEKLEEVKPETFKEPTEKITPTEKVKPEVTPTKAPVKKVVNIEKLKNLMVKENVFWEDIEKAMDRKLDMDKSLDRAIAYNYLGKASVKPTPSPLVEEANEQISALMRVGNAQARLDRNWILREASRRAKDRREQLRLEDELTNQARQDKVTAMNDFYESLSPKHKIGDEIIFQRYTSAGIYTINKKIGDKWVDFPSPEETGQKIKAKIQGADFDVSQSLQQQAETGFPSSFEFKGLYATEIETGQNFEIYSTDFINGETLSTTIKTQPEDVLKEAIKTQQPPKTKAQLTDIYTKAHPAGKVDKPAEVIKKVKKEAIEEAKPTAKTITVLPDKEKLLTKIKTAIAKAPDIAVTTDTVPFQIDGGADILNTKTALQTFYDKVRKTPATMVLGEKVKKITLPPRKGLETFQRMIDTAETREAERLAVKNFEEALKMPEMHAEKEYFTKSFKEEGFRLAKQAKKVDLHPELETFVHKFNGDWIVSEAKTGLKMSVSIEGATPEKAITNAKQRMKEIGIAKAKENIAKTKEISPRYKVTTPSKKPAEVAQALESKQWEVKMPKEPEIAEKINKTQILASAEKAFKVPIRTRATHRFKAVGMYYTREELIRLRKWGELEPMTHEIAHHLDKKIMQALGKSWKRELAPAGQKRAVIKELADLDYRPKRRKTSEGFAEFMRYFLTTDKAQSKAPLFYKFFTQDFLKNNLDVSSKLSVLKKQLDIWQKQGAENRIQAQIDFKEEHIKIGRVIDKVQKAKDWVMKNWNDEFYYPQKIVSEIEKIKGRKLKPSENPAKMMEYSKSKAGIIARTFVMEKAVNMKGEVVGAGLTEILKPISQDKMKQFITYAVARRAILKESQGKETGIDIDDAKYIVNKYKNETWDEAVKGITKWGDNLMNWIVDAGGLGREELAIIKEMNPIWLPFKRAFVDDLAVIKGAGGFVNRGQAIKRMKGSARPIINPMETLIAQATETIAKAQKIHIAKLFADLSATEGVGGFMTRVPAPMEATTFTLEKVQKDLESLGINTSDADLDSILTVFSQGWQYRGKDNIISLWRNGRREFFEIHPDLYRALTGMDMLQRGPILKLLAPFARLLRLGATGARVAFGIRNPWRDAFTYAVLSKNKTATIFDPIIGTYKSVKATPTNNPLIWRFKAMGGQLSGMIGFDRAATMSVYDEMLLSQLGGKGKVLKVVKHPINALRDLISITELGPRSVELEKMYNKYLKEHPDWTEEDAWIEAFNDAQDVTVNFTKSGYYSKRVNEAAAFFNVAIRGPEKIFRSIRKRPIQTIVKALLWITSFAIGNWALNKDKQWYKNLPLSYKYNNFWIEIGDTVYRLPIPFDLGMIFSAAPIAGLESLYSKNPEPIKAWLKMVKMQFPNPTPSMFKPWLDVAQNKDFLDRPIETPGMQYLPVTERKRRYTTAVASALSRGANKLGLSYSPVQIDYMINNYTGGWARQLPLRKIKGKEDIPVLGEFILRNPNRPARQMNEFYLIYEALNQKKQAGMITRKERQQLNKLKPLYRRLTLYNRRLKIYYKKENELRINEILEGMTKQFKRYGFE